MYIYLHRTLYYFHSILHYLKLCASCLLLLTLQYSMLLSQYTSLSTHSEDYLTEAVCLLFIITYPAILYVTFTVCLIRCTIRWTTFTEAVCLLFSQCQLIELILYIVMVMSIVCDNNRNSKTKYKHLDYQFGSNVINVMSLTTQIETF